MRTIHARRSRWRRDGTSDRVLDLGPNPSSAIAMEERASCDPVGQIRVARWRVRESRLGVQEVGPLALRLIFPQELSLLLDVAGLELVARFGDSACNLLTPVP